VKSLTKKFVIPGLRLGYLIANENLIQKIRAIKPPWTVNSMALAAGSFLMQNNSAFKFSFKDLLEETNHLKNSINEMDALEVVPGYATYFLVKTNKGTAAELKDFLMNENGLLIRNAGNFKGLDEKYFRIATQSREQNQLLIKALKSWIQK
ncbi:MAG: aminotransferase class I/II-fold pyridoxal phosphate-dependent enzyme, partial [Bacteroidales bacterium]|nr:aminotransferase class I/II-fold pyridoxal phosphate-dependent enzyme [Bacteroidales bacterium]